MSLNLYLRTCYLEDMRRRKRSRLARVTVPAVVLLYWLVLYVVVSCFTYGYRHPETPLRSYPQHHKEILQWQR